jgi:hypothetical protein
MNLPRSAERILSWRSQVHRVERWLARLAPKEPISGIEKLDFYLAFFMNCYALRDWFINGQVIGQSDMDALINLDPSMCLCRDICNRAKHFTLTRRASADANFQIAREYDHFHNESRWLVFAEGKNRELYELASECNKFWKDFVESRNPQEAPYPV